MRIAFVTSRLIRRSAAADQRRHSAGDHGNRRGKKGPFATRDKPMPEEPKKEPVVLSKRDKRIGVLRLDKARLEDRNNHWMKGYEKILSLCWLIVDVMYRGVYSMAKSDRLQRKSTRIRRR